MFHPFISVYDHSNRFKYVNAKPRSPNISNMPKVSLLHHNFKWEALLGYLCMHHRYAEGVPFWDWRCWCSLGWLDWSPQSHAHSWHHGARSCQTNGPMFCTRPMDHSPLWGREPLLRSCSSFARIDSPPRVKCWPKNSPSTSRHSSKSASLSTWPWPRMFLAHFSLACVWKCCLEHVVSYVGPQAIGISGKDLEIISWTIARHHRFQGYGLFVLPCAERGSMARPLM